MRERDIRQALLCRIRNKNKSSDSRLVEEMGLCVGTARIDIAVINGSLQGFEIKSDDDTLTRLPSQRDIYNRVFEFVTVATTARHANTIANMVPPWWGIIEAFDSQEGPKLRVLRRQRRNPGVDPLAVVQLLWRDEALSVLAELGADEGLRSAPRKRLWGAIAANTNQTALVAIVKRRLKQRQDWRAVRSRISDVG